MKPEKTHSYNEVDCALCILMWFIDAEMDTDNFGGLCQLRETIIEDWSVSLESAYRKAVELCGGTDSFASCFDLELVPAVMESIVREDGSIPLLPQADWDKVVYETIKKLEGL